VTRSNSCWPAWWAGLIRPQITAIVDDPRIEGADRYVGVGAGTGQQGVVVLAAVGRCPIGGASVS